MDRAIRLSNLWNWLPAFRIVAETQHLPTAAKQLNVSASSVSRSIKLLEDQLGYPLFVRTPRALRLNAEGELLLAAVRESMRRIDDALVSDPMPSSRVRVAGPSPWLAAIVLPAQAALVDLVIDVVDIDVDDVGAALLRGDIDLAIGEHFVAADQIAIEELGTVQRAIYHSPALAFTESTPFAVWSGDDDSWPAATPRKVTLKTSRLELILDACIRGGHAACLPVVLAPAALTSASALPSSVLLLAQRATGPASPMVDQVRAVARALLPQ